MVTVIILHGDGDGDGNGASGPKEQTRFPMCLNYSLRMDSSFATSLLTSNTSK